MTIKIYTNIQDLTGIGEEWLITKNEELIAIFINGMIKKGINYTEKSSEDTICLI